LQVAERVATDTLEFTPRPRSRRDARPAHNDASLFTSARKAFCANGGIDASGPNRKPECWFCTGPDTP
jgi:hypothetical protein